MAGKIIISNPSGGTPSGNDKEVQFNDGGSFGGGAQLFWDKVNDRLGLGDSTPAQQLSLTKSIELLTTTSSAIGVIYKGANRFMHDFHHPAGGGAIPYGYNVFVGIDAGNFSMGSTATENVHGSYNVAIGREALLSNTIGYCNTAIGTYALRSNTTGYNNSATGIEALKYNTTGYLNVAVGMYALRSNTTGYNNVAVGIDALRLNTTGHYNAAIGIDALRNNVIGSNNIAVGTEALKGNTTGSYNAAIGSGTLLNNTSGHHNVGIGKEALLFNTTGHYNAALGTGALLNNTTGYYSVALGANALLYNDTGYYNIGIGIEALTFNTTGYYNIGIGTNALRGALASSDISGNTVIGYRAGYSILTGGDNNIFVGYQAGDNITTGATNIIIGYDLNALSITADYQLNIGSLIFGDLGATKKVGINTSTLNETLSVGGAIRLGTSALTNTGTIRWSGTDFEGYTGAAWASLTGGGGLWSDGGTHLFPTGAPNLNRVEILQGSFDVAVDTQGIRIEVDTDSTSDTYEHTGVLVDAKIAHTVTTAGEPIAWLSFNSKIEVDGNAADGRTWGYMDSITRGSLTNARGHWGYHVEFDCSGTHNFSDAEQDLTGYMCGNSGTEKMNDAFFFNAGTGGAYSGICMAGSMDYGIDLIAPTFANAAIALGQTKYLVCYTSGSVKTMEIGYAGTNNEWRTFGGKPIVMYNATNSETMASFCPNGECNFYYNGVSKFYTVDTGVIKQGIVGSAGHSLPRDNNRCMDNVTPDGAGGFYVFQSKNAAGTIMDSVQLNGGLEIATTGSEDGCFDVCLYRDGTVKVISFNAYLDSFMPADDNIWDLGTLNKRWKDIRYHGTLYGTGTMAVKLQSITPGFWLDETGAGNKGCCVVLDAKIMQFQRRAQGFGAYEAAPFRFDLSNGNGTFDGTVTASCGVLTCDHVFEDDYGLLSLECLAKYVKKEKKLPRMTINEGGSYSTATMREEVVEKLEEQALYIIQLHKRINVLEEK